MKLILASASPRRRSLLKQLRIPFHVIPSHVSEASSIRQPARLVRELAYRKANAVAKNLKDGVVLGADTLVVCRGKILGKPKNTKDAYRMLYGLAGTTHRVYTGGFDCRCADETALDQPRSLCVRMKKLPLTDLIRLSRKHLDKAGSYAIQEKTRSDRSCGKGVLRQCRGIARAVRLKRF